MILSAPAKINLFLRITGKRDDGFHAIETLFLPISELADTLKIEFIPDGKRAISVKCDHPSVPCGKDNLCWKAADLILNALKVTDSIRVVIRKRIPVAGGMGGGSSDAGTLIRALQERYGFLPDLGAAAALECGSDVPFFLNPVPSIGTGRGEILTPVHGIQIPEIRIIPMNFPISAKWAYTHLAPGWKEDPRTLEDMLTALKNGNFSDAAKFLRNDLAPAVFEKFPILKHKKELFERENPDWKVQLSGSGATLFAIRFQD